MKANRNLTVAMRSILMAGCLTLTPFCGIAHAAAYNCVDQQPYDHHNAKDIALINRGFDLYWGNGDVKIDKSAAFKCFKEAADRGNVFGLYWMGKMTKQGEATPKDQMKAEAYFDQVFDLLDPMAEAGDVMAQLYLGWTYENCAVGDSFARMAAHWYRKAAEQNDANACYCMALCYMFGFGVIQDDNEAIEWTRKAAELGNNASQYNLGAYYMNSQDFENGRLWWQKASKSGHGGASYMLANMYLLGDGVEQSLDRAIEYYKRAADKGHVDALYEMGVYYTEGKGVQQSYTKAFQCWQSALEYAKPELNPHQEQTYFSGSLEFNLSSCYMQGRGCKASREKAIELLKAAKAHGHAKAAEKLRELGVKE